MKYKECEISGEKSGIEKRKKTSLRHDKLEEDEIKNRRERMKMKCVEEIKEEECKIDKRRKMVEEKSKVEK